MLLPVTFISRFCNNHICVTDWLDDIGSRTMLRAGTRWLSPDQLHLLVVSACRDLPPPLSARGRLSRWIVRHKMANTPELNDGPWCAGPERCSPGGAGALAFRALVEAAADPVGAAD